MKVVVNRCHGGFGLSQKAVVRYLELIGKKCFSYARVSNNIYVKVSNDTDDRHLYHFTEDCGESIKNIDDHMDCYFYNRDVDRDDPALLQTIEELGEESFGSCAKLEIIDIPDDVKWFIGEYDGYETVEEQHRSW